LDNTDRHIQTASGGTPDAPAATIDIEQLVNSFLHNPHRVFAVDCGGRRLWVKRIRKNLPNPLAALIHAAARKITGRNELAQADHEIESLKALRRHGFITPEIVFRNPYYFVLSDIGPSLEAAILQADEAERFRIVRMAGQALRKLHDADRWHGAARVHNMTLSGNHIGFIDLENMVEAWLPLPLRKFWDLWQLGHSAAFFEPSMPLAEAALRAYGDSPVRKSLWVTAWVFVGTYLSLKPFQNGSKREVRQTVGCMAAIYRLPRKSPDSD
jgi:hypothetical protein